MSSHYLLLLLHLLSNCREPAHHSHHRKPVYHSWWLTGEQELRALWVMYYVGVSSLLTVEVLIGSGSIHSIAREDQLTIH